MKKVIVALGTTLAVAAASPAHADTAVLAGGCFWGMEAVFEHVKGVSDVVSGYAGGTAAGAHYEAADSGHAEAVRISYDPKQISYAQLLQIFFAVAHDPTQVNRQGPDEGPSYRSAVFPQNASQTAQAKTFIARLNAVACIQGANRHQDRARGLLAGRGLSSGFRAEESKLSVHRGQRPAEGRSAEAPLPGTLPRVRR